MSVVVKIAQKMGAEMNTTRADVAGVKENVTAVEGDVAVAQQAIEGLSTGKADDAKVNQEVARLDKAVADVEKKSQDAMTVMKAELLDTDADLIETQKMHLAEIQENEETIEALKSLAVTNKQAAQDDLNGYRSEVGTYEEFETTWNGVVNA